MTLSRARFFFSLNAIPAWKGKAPAITFSPAAIDALAATRPDFATRPVQNFGLAVDRRQAGSDL